MEHGHGQHVEGGCFRSSELWSVALILRCGLGSVGVCLIADGLHRTAITL